MPPPVLFQLQADLALAILSEHVEFARSTAAGDAVWLSLWNVYFPGLITNSFHQVRSHSVKFLLFLFRIWVKCDSAGNSTTTPLLSHDYLTGQLISQEERKVLGKPLGKFQWPRFYQSLVWRFPFGQLRTQAGSLIVMMMAMHTLLFGGIYTTE